MSIVVPKVFISYSYDDQAHKKWVLELAQRLRNAGVDAILDQFRVGLGDDFGE
ncbi:toll/interleukin-1 receptor domain-containing protein [Vibrio atlanticus]|uniref:toll/interleukin-1 receptor domain-containing protein n=1 Tax=Vibrio atlanticus TaxID=693153 RepID=UPI0022AF19DA|nr:toll/interleukin-1 receptor domain-containing protein [Vibrio atlanticus]MCZ4309896.1 toll/interleukin-1 receptor domain-containing protein [Vibrio atlanticus]